MTTLSHITAREYIQQLADGEALRTEARQALHQHLDECPECRAYAQEIKALHQTLARALRARWEQQPLPSRSWPPVTRPPVRPWSPLAQVMVMLTMTVMILSLLPEWSRLPVAPTMPRPTETQPVPVIVDVRLEDFPDEALENLTSLDTRPPAEPVEAAADDPAPIVYPYYLNNPDHRVSRAQ
jgi:hypothetical protein